MFRIGHGIVLGLGQDPGTKPFDVADYAEVKLQTRDLGFIQLDDDLPGVGRSCTDQGGLG